MNDKPTLIVQLRNYVEDGDTRFGALRELAAGRIAVLEHEVRRLQAEIERLKRSMPVGLD
jgi:hypothetical protein